MGFSDKKARVYLALLQHGEMSAAEVAKKTKILRTTVYDILKDLMKSGFVAVANDKGEKRKFIAEGPERLVDFVDGQAQKISDQKKVLEEKQEELKDLIPQLKSLSDEVIGKPKVQFYDGAKGLVEALNFCLISKQPIMIYGSIEAWNRWMPDHFQWFVGEIDKRRIEVRQVDQKTISKLRGEEENVAGGWPIRFLPVGFNLPGFSLIYGEKVLLASFQRPMATIFEDREYAANQKTVFELFWQFLK